MILSVLQTAHELSHKHSGTTQTGEDVSYVALAPKTEFYFIFFFEHHEDD